MTNTSSSNNSSSGVSDPSAARFDHRFNGWSVWLEFRDDSQGEPGSSAVARLHQLMEEMRTTAFQHNCDDGNDDDDKNSQYRFSLHMTLLYNFELLSGSSALNNGAVSE